MYSIFNLGSRTIVWETLLYIAFYDRNDYKTNKQLLNLQTTIHGVGTRE